MEGPSQGASTQVPDRDSEPENHGEFKPGVPLVPDLQRENKVACIRPSHVPSRLVTRGTETVPKTVTERAQPMHLPSMQITATHGPSHVPTRLVTKN